MTTPEARLAELVSSIAEGLVLLDAEGEVEECSDSAKRILGLTADQIGCKTPPDQGWRAVHEDGSPFPWETHPGMVTLRTGLPQSGVIMGVSKPEGGPTWVSINSRPVVREGKGAGALVTFSEQRGLRERSRPIDSLFGHQSVGVVITGADRRCLEVNDAWCRMTGYSREELAGLDWAVLTDPKDLAADSAEFQRLTAGEIDNYALRKQFIRKDGSILPCAISVTCVRGSGGSPDCVIGLATDLSERQEAEEALAESEAKYRAVFLNTPDALFLATLEEGRILEINDAFVGLSGYSREELIGRTVVELGLYADRDARARVVAELKRTGRVSGFETKARKKDGGTRLVSLSYTTLRLKGELLIVGAVQDITASRLAEKRLRESEERFSAFMSHLPAAAFVKDGEGRVVFTNRYLAELLGFRDWEGEATESLVPGEVGHRMAEDDRRALAEGPLEIRETVVDASGNTRIFETIKFPIRVEEGDTFLGGVSVDVTERVRAEAGLREAVRFNQQVLDCAREGVVVYGRDLRYRLWNRFMEQLTGVAAEDVLGRHPLEVFPFLRDAGVIESLEKVLAGGPPVTRDFSFSLANGKAGWASDVSAPLRDEDGEIVGVIATVREISDRQRAEEALRISEERFAKIFHSNPVALAVTKLNGSPEVVEVNEAFGRVFGESREECLGRGAPDFWADAAERERIMDGLRAGGSLRGVECRLKRRNGEVFQGRVSAELIQVGGEPCMLSATEDVSEQKRLEDERETMLRVLRVANSASDLRGLIGGVTSLLQEWCGCDAVGVRLREGEDFPYFETRGFPAEFVAAESRLCTREPDGQAKRDSQGNPVLECICGGILTGGLDPKKSLFTEDGSFLTGSSGEITAAGIGADRQRRIRNRCNREGYETIALIPLRSGGETLGLLQLNDRRKGRISREQLSVLERAAANLSNAVAQKQAAQARSDSEARYRALFEAANDAVMVAATEADGSAGPIVTVNHVAVERLGYTPEEFAGMTVADIDAAGSDEARLGAFERIRRDGHATFEMTHRAKDGRLIPVEISARQFFLDKRAFVLAISRDISERKLVEASLREREAELAAAQAIAHVGSWKWDFKTDEASWSDETFRIFGQLPRPLSRHRMNLLDMIHPEDRERVDRALADALHGVRYDVQYRIQRPDGEEKVIRAHGEAMHDGSGQPTALRGTVHDVTEYTRAQDALRKVAVRLQLAADSGGLGIWEWDIESGTSIWDDRMFELYGTAKNRFDGGFEAWRSAVHPDDLGRAEKAIASALRGERPYEVEFRVVHPGGEVRHIKAHGIVERDGEGRPLRVTGLNRDITAAKEAEQEREKLQAQLLQAQKMESIGRLAGGVAHDFNNLLTVINGYSKLALGRLEGGDPLYPWLQEIHKAGERSARLTRQLLAFSRKQLLQPLLLNLNGAVEQMRGMLERLVGEDVELELELDERNPVVHADPNQLEQVIMNLAVNAKDAMPQGGRLRIGTGLVERDAAYGGRHPEVVPGRYAMLYLTDTGTGMDDATRQRIFEPFFTTKEVGKGTGLGLAMVQGIIMQSGGHIEVSSEPGAGSTFRIYLPAVERATAENGKAAEAQDVRGSEAILVVEDQREVRRFAVAVLKACGYRVTEAGSAEEAQSLCETAGEPFDLILTDVVMPHTGGRELIDRVGKTRPGSKALFMSGYSDTVIADHGVMQRGTHFIQKPFTADELARKVREVLGPARPKFRIVVADGEPGVRSFLRAVLSRAGYAVRETRDGKAAAGQARSGEADLVIMDLVMPEEKGAEEIRRLRGEAPDVGIIAISDPSGGGNGAAVQMPGADAVLEKPIDLEALLAKVGEVLRTRRPRTQA